MQALPPIPADNAPAPAASGSGNTPSAAAKGQFRQELREAGNKLSTADNTGQKDVGQQSSILSDEDIAIESLDELMEFAVSDAGQELLQESLNQVVSVPDKAAGNPRLPQQVGTPRLPDLFLQSMPEQTVENMGWGKTLDNPGKEHGSITAFNELMPGARTTSAENMIQPTSSDAPEPTIVNWRAQFRYHQAVMTTKPGQKGLASQQETGPVSIVAGQSAFKEVYPAPTSGRSAAGAPLPPADRRDATGNFIHSNLPGFIEKTAAQTTSDGRQMENNNSMLNSNSRPGSAPEVQAKSNMDTPLIFTLDQDTSSQGIGSSQNSTPVDTLRLPSGTEVPHTRIVNQVVDHFSMHRTLESGSVTLKLHPAELGELRMEIKVEQDNIRAHITTQNPQVQEILDRHLPRLREALQQQGMHLDHMEVTVANDRGDNPQNFQEQYNQRKEQRFSGTRENKSVFTLDPRPEPSPAIAPGRPGSAQLSVLA